MTDLIPAKWVDRIDWFDNEKDWLDARQTYVGGSAAPALFNQGYKNTSPLSVWESLVFPGQAPPLTGEFLDLGLRLEQSIADEYMHRTGAKLWGNAYNIWRHPEYGYMACTPDFIDFENEENVQIKNVSSFASKEWENDEYPLKYEVQVQHEMLATGMKSSKLVALLGGQSVAIRHVERNDEWINDVLMPTIKAFWENHVETKVQPDLEGVAGEGLVLARLHPEDNGKAVSLPPNFMTMLDEISPLKQSIKELKDELDVKESIIKNELGDNTYGETSDLRAVSWKSQNRKTYDIPDDIKELYRVEDKVIRVLRFPKSLPKGVHCE